MEFNMQYSYICSCCNRSSVYKPGAYCDICQAMIDASEGKNNSRKEEEKKEKK